MHADICRLPSGNFKRSPSEGLPGLSGDLWPIHPHRLDDELLSFWIVRTAHSNGLKLQTFTSLALGRNASLWTRDIDRSASDELLGRLSAQTGSSIVELKAGMLSAFEGILFERHHPNGKKNWLLPLGIYHRTRRDFGMQFCPLCLSMDTIPYFRRRWRLAFSTICDRHGVMLHDRCPTCKAPVVYFRNDLGHRKDYKLTNHTLCSQCGFDLCRAPAYSPPAPDGRSIMALRSLVTFHDLGWWFVGSKTLPYQHLYLDALHHLLMVLSWPLGKRLLDYIEAQTGWSASVGNKQGRTVFESLSVATRHKLLVSALWLLDEWPDRFLRTATDCRLTQSRILKSESLPFWFESAVRLNLGAGHSSGSAEEAKHAAAYLAKRGAVSGQAVGRLLGSRDALASKAYAKKKAGPITDAEFRRRIDITSAEIAALRPRSYRRLLLQRDRTILRLIRMTGWSVKKVLAMTVSDAAMLASTPKGERKFCGAVAGVLLTYQRDTRRYLAGDGSGDALFIGWRRGAIGEKDFRQRIKHLIPINSAV